MNKSYFHKFLSIASMTISILYQFQNKINHATLFIVYAVLFYLLSQKK